MSLYTEQQNTCALTSLKKKLKNATVDILTDNQTAIKPLELECYTYTSILIWNCIDPACNEKIKLCNSVTLPITSHEKVEQFARRIQIYLFWDQNIHEYEGAT